MKKITIEITPGTAEAIQKLDDRYFFGLFKEVSKCEDDERQFRDALEEIGEQILEKEGLYEALEEGDEEK
jgi:hypothetical protein